MSDEMLLHPWLAGITVAGELEAMERIQARLRASLSASAQNAAAVELVNEQDALKPVGSLISTPAGSLPSSFTEAVPAMVMRPDMRADDAVQHMSIDPITPPDSITACVPGHGDRSTASTAATGAPNAPYTLSHHHQTSSHHHQTSTHPHRHPHPHSHQPPGPGPTTQAHFAHAMATPQVAALATPRAGPSDHRPTASPSRTRSPSPHALPRPVATPVQ